MTTFEQALAEHGLTLRRTPLRVLQVNVGNWKKTSISSGAAASSSKASRPCGI